jgi:hypothetical protein
VITLLAERDYFLMGEVIVRFIHFHGTVIAFHLLPGLRGKQLDAKLAHSLNPQLGAITKKR